MKTILITGGEGFIGKRLSESLSKENYKIISFDLFHSSKNKKIKQFNGSILNPYDLDRAMKKCDYVIHLAAMVGVELTEKKRLECLEINIEGVKAVLDSAIKQKVKKVFFSSSSEVYGDQEIFPIKENAELKPKSNYGITKLVGEEYLKAYSYNYGIQYNIFRFFNLYGESQRSDFVISKFKEQIKNNKPIEIYGSGNQIRSYCYISDAIDGIKKIIKKGKKNCVYNIGNNNEPISVIDLAKKMIKISKKKIKIKKITFDKSDRTLDREIFKRQPDISRISSELKYFPRVTLDIGLKKVLSK